MINPKWLIWVSVLLSAVAQIFLKTGMTRLRGRKSGKERSAFSLVLGALGEIFVWFWAFSFVVALILWIVGLQKVDLSYAYPLVSGGYVLVTVLAALFLREKVPGNRWFALTLICLGVWLISAS
jgi:multidrug transporter EmrE-like cation transporter